MFNALKLMAWPSAEPNFNVLYAMSTNFFVLSMLSLFVSTGSKKYLVFLPFAVVADFLNRRNLRRALPGFGDSALEDLGVKESDRATEKSIRICLGCYVLLSGLLSAALYKNILPLDAIGGVHDLSYALELPGYSGQRIEAVLEVLPAFQIARTGMWFLHLATSVLLIRTLLRIFRRGPFLSQMWLTAGFVFPGYAGLFVLVVSELLFFSGYQIRETGTDFLSRMFNPGAHIFALAILSSLAIIFFLGSLFLLLVQYAAHLEKNRNIAVWPPAKG